MPTLVESHNEYCERHGGPTIRVQNYCIFPDGAILTDSGQRGEPPTEPTAKLRVDYLYAQGLLKKLETEFAMLKNHIVQQTQIHVNGFGPSVHPQAMVDLKTLQQQVIAQRAKLLELNQQIRQLPGHQPDYGRQRDRAEGQKMLGELMQLQI